MLKRERNISAYIALVFLLFQNSTADDAKRRRQTSNAEACSEIDYRAYSADCFEFIGLASWNQDFLDLLCSDDKLTDKSMTATLCPNDEVDIELYYTGLRLAILNTMYGTAPIPERGDCGYWCMYDPLYVRNEGSEDAVGYRWSGSGGCWNLMFKATDPRCYGKDGPSEEWLWAQYKEERWCLGSVCESYGDPHVYNFDGVEVPLRHSIGDYLMYHSTTLRIDVRMLPYYTNEGMLWGSVTGIHATAIQVIDGDCDVKIEVYSRHQTENNEVKFRFNEEDVGWNELENKFGSCPEICSESDLYEIDEDNSFFTVTFADGVMVTLRNVENMHTLFITVPYLTLAVDAGLLNDAQVCKGDKRLLNCENDPTILSQYINCEVQTPPPTPGACDINVEKIVTEACTECPDNPCLIDRHVKSCIFDGCIHPALREAWISGDESLALRLARELADDYCEMSRREIELNPSLCPTDPSPMPTPYFEDLPTRAPTVSPSPEPTISPSSSPTNSPTSSPTQIPTEYPTQSPTLSPTNTPTAKPTQLPTQSPTYFPTPQPTKSPTPMPSPLPTADPSHHPTASPTPSPTISPTRTPTQIPTQFPTWSPTSNPICPYLAYSLACDLPSNNSYISITGIEDLDEEAGLRYCAERCFRENTDWFVYKQGDCKCVIGRCLTPLEGISGLQTYRILPCGLECSEITSEEWWGQEPTSTEHINAIISTKTVKGLRFTSEVNVEVYMVGIEVLLTTDDPPELIDTSLRIIPRIFSAGENRILASGQEEMPAFMGDIYDGSYGRMAMSFLTANIHNKYPFTLSFEFHKGTADVFVSDDTHYFHDGHIADDVFAVRGNILGEEPNKVDLKAPHVVLCYLVEPCEIKYSPEDFSIEHMEMLCPDGYGGTDKTISTSCSGIPFLETTIKSSLVNKFFDTCEAECVFDNNWPLDISFRWNINNILHPDGCWELSLECAIIYPNVAEFMYKRSRDLASCDNYPSPTPVPTPNPEEVVECDMNEIVDGTRILLSIHAAYEVIDEICDKIGERTALLDGGFVFGSNCSAVLTDNVTEHDFDLMLCSSYETYCDYGEVLLSPNFSVDNEATLELLKLTDLLAESWSIIDKK